MSSSRGLIPALAGKTVPLLRPSQSRRAHPRAGGENHLPRRSPVRAAGSSPRWRGKPGSCAFAPGVVGLIPALAGKTTTAPEKMYTARAHPRAGGENAVGDGPARTDAGSSPRWRGKQLRRRIIGASSRLIPALAGKTHFQYGSCREPRAHPRAGGENDCSRSAAALTAGSSPRWRGKRSRPYAP